MHGCGARSSWTGPGCGRGFPAVASVNLDCPPAGTQDPGWPDVGAWMVLKLRYERRMILLWSARDFKRCTSGNQVIPSTYRVQSDNRPEEISSFLLNGHNRHAVHSSTSKFSFHQKMSVTITQHLGIRWTFDKLNSVAKSRDVRY